MSRLNKEDKYGLSIAIVGIMIVILGAIGEVRCIYKMCKCNWEPIGKAEISYTVGTFTGLGAIIGWFDIQDN